MPDVKTYIEQGKAVVGIELGSTRIKAVLLDEEHNPAAMGSHSWENKLENGYWTYELDEVWKGLQDCYRDLCRDVTEKFGVALTKIAALGISGMMHGYLAFDKDGQLLTPFRTWRNTNARKAAGVLTELFDYNIPERWSVAQLYQSILHGEEHVPDIGYIATLSAYVHWKLTGEKVIGVGDASGMFPIDFETGTYYTDMLDKFDHHIADRHYPWKITDLMPKVLKAGDCAGVLTKEGAKLLDPSGKLEDGVPLCPPEGDAGTGMVATNSVARRTGNVSVGTSIFAMIVLDKKLSKLYREIDMVATPDGALVAMVHANNCTSDLNGWISLFKEFADLLGVGTDMDGLFSLLYNKALEGDTDCGGLLSYGYYSGEFITGMEEGRPLFVRTPDSRFTLANFMRTHLYSMFGALRMGMDILTVEEHVQIESLLGHGGLFKTPGVGQKIMAAALNTPVSVMKTAGEGGPWGVALLAAYMIKHDMTETLEQYLNENVFAGNKGNTAKPDKKDADGFNQFMVHYKAGLLIERNAAEVLK